MTQSSPVASLPVFWAPGVTTPQGGVVYTPGTREPITSVEKAEQYKITDGQLAAYRTFLRDHGIDVNPANILHAIEADALRGTLSDLGINPRKKVSATRDRTGLVALTFAELRRLLDQAHAA